MVKRLEHWPQHRLSFAAAGSFGVVLAITAVDGNFGWIFWGLALFVVLLVALGAREKRATSSRMSITRRN